MKELELTMGQRHMCISFLNGSKPGNIGEIRKISRVCKPLEEGLANPEQGHELPEDWDTATDIILFEDADFVFLKKQFIAFDNWVPAARKLVIKLDEAIENARIHVPKVENDVKEE